MDPATAALIAGAVSSIVGYYQTSGSNQQARASNRNVSKAQKMLKPGKIGRVASELRPQIRAQIAAGMGPALKQRVLQSLASLGYSNTGAGEAMSNMTFAAPDIIAGQTSFDLALELQKARASALLGGAQIQAGTRSQTSPAAGALAAGLTGFLTTKHLLKGEEETDSYEKASKDTGLFISSDPLMSGLSPELAKMLGGGQ